MRARSALLLGGVLALGAAAPRPAEAHGLVGRSDLPIPEWLFAWGAAVVLIVSFVALAALWPRPKLETGDWRPLPGGLDRVASPALPRIACGLIGVLLLVLVVWAGLAGSQVATANFTPTFVYVVFWLGLVPVSLLLGDVFRLFNPWLAIGRAFSWTAARAGEGGLPAALPYPERLGRWPAALGLLCFAWMELASAGGDTPRNLAIATLVYSAATFLGMALYGVEAWIDRGEAFSVYFNLYSRISPVEARDGRLGLRRPLSALTRLAPLPGTVALLAVMIGSVTFDGASEGGLWSDIAPDISDFFQSLGASPSRGLELAYTVGLAAAVLLVGTFYRLGIAGARALAGGPPPRELAAAFVHSLVPIALVYAAAHYVTLLLYQGQAIVYLASDPFGRGSDILGTAGRSIDYGVLGATTAWYLQVGFVVAGHVAALTLAHDRALVVYEQGKAALRSQYWMLGIMVGFTILALALLSQANQ